MPLTKEFLKQLREMESGVTPGNWVSDRYSINAGEYKAFTSCRSNTDAQFIAALRNNIIPLLDEIERLQGENERLKKEIDFAYKHL